MPDEILTVAELAKYLRVNRFTIYKLLKARRLPAFKIGSDWRFNREQIDQWRLRQESDWTGKSPKESGGILDRRER
jgi:excisionase family DNA binding protein